jgi:hypothetical protein
MNRGWARLQTRDKKAVQERCDTIQEGYNRIQERCSLLWPWPWRLSPSRAAWLNRNHVTLG